MGGTGSHVPCVDVPVAASTWVERALICLVWTCLWQPPHGWNGLSCAVCGRACGSLHMGGTGSHVPCVDVPVAASTWVERALICLVWTCLWQPPHG
eukprot:361550-Chlamydomonas_euryale.AAC.1